MRHTLLALTTTALLAGGSALALAQTNNMGTSGGSNMNAPTTSGTMPGSNNGNGASSGTTRSMSSGAMNNGTSGRTATSSQRVKSIQSALDQKGQHVTVDGKWGKQTAAAIRSFQKENGLKATGRADHQTMQKLGVSG